MITKKAIETTFHAMANEQHIFIHSYPRTRSSWFAETVSAPGSKEDKTSLFYEPLHESLRSATPEGCKERFENFGKSLRHPERAEHQFSAYEFEPEGGVAEFEKRFSFEEYALSPEDLDPSLQGYLSSLLEQAENSGQRACLKFVRSPLRANWMAEKLGGKHIYLYRHPRAMDNSNYSFRGSLNRYSKYQALTLGKNGLSALIAPLTEWSGMPEIERESFEDELKEYGRVLQADRKGRYDRQFDFDVTTFLWATGLAEALKYADVIVDTDIFAKTSDSQEVREQVESVSGSDFDLSSYTVKPLPKVDFVPSEEVLALARDALEKINPDWQRLEEFPMTDRCREFLDRVLRS